MKHDDVGICPDHVSDDLVTACGFSTKHAMFAFADALSNGGKRKTVRMPPEKTPEGLLSIVFVRCPRCSGRGCGTCSMHGWGVRAKASKRGGVA